MNANFYVLSVNTPSMAYNLFGQNKLIKNE